MREKSLIMGIGKDFLENSSICGFAHISNSKGYSEKACWILVSILMIAGAGYLTKDAFDEWDLDPISTVTEVLTSEVLISNGKFPLIVVCPPKG